MEALHCMNHLGWPALEDITGGPLRQRRIGEMRRVHVSIGYRGTNGRGPTGSPGSATDAAKQTVLYFFWLQFRTVREIVTCVLEMHTESWIPGQVTAGSQVRS